MSAQTALDDHRLVEAEYGVVREVQSTTGGGERFGIEITVPGVCDSCVIRENCYGAGSRVWAASDEPLEPGEQVRLEMRKGTVLKATAWVYGIPLVAVLAGTLVGHRWLFAARPEEPRVLLSFALGVALMLASGVVLARLNDWIGRRLTITAHSLARR
ncbi:MAG: SoxR reducing system RseC family protein [Spirochaetota bacterium]